MSAPSKIYFNWSTGKDSALALYHLQRQPRFAVTHLLTSINKVHNRVSMHGLRRALMEAQITALGLPFSTIELPEEPTMQEYDVLMRETVQGLREQGFNYAAFGDIFLEDLKTYREEQLEVFGIKAVFPLWKRDTRQLLEEFIELGFKAIVVCINAGLLNQSFAGRIIDHNFLRDLPASVDPCGENGEFHTFCFDGPVFNHPVSFEIGEKVYREYEAPATNEQEQPSKIGFWFCDLLKTGSNG